MAGEADEDDTLDLTEDMKLDEADDTSGDDEDIDDSDQGDDDDASDDGEEETVIGFAEEGEGADDPNDSSVIRRLRAELRDAKKRATELERAQAKPKIEIGEKPTLAGCGFDEDAFEQELDNWKARKAAAEEADRADEEREQRVQEAWQKDVAAYQAKKANLGVSDYADAEQTVEAALNMTQQAVIVKVAANPAAFIYALSKSDAKLAEIAKFEDPIKLAAAVARMEGAVKVEKRRKGPAIDRAQTGSGKMPGGTDKQLEKLEKDAERTGNRTKLINYKKQKGIS